MLAVAQDAQGEERVRPVVEERGVEFPVLMDSGSALAAAIGFGIVPSGVFVDDAGVVRYKHLDDFDIGDPRVRWNLERFLDGEPTESPADGAPMARAALELFARGAALYAAGEAEEALALWREALGLDADNFVIRSQIWVAEHPERFYPVVDRDWQELQLLKEGYDKPLP
jgi:tetratricopeptide (TPR) repeat protein